MATLFKKPDWDRAILKLLGELCTPDIAANAAFDPVYRFRLIKSTAELMAPREPAFARGGPETPHRGAPRRLQ